MLVFGDGQTNYAYGYPDINYSTSLTRGLFQGAGIVPGNFPLGGKSGMGDISISNPLVLIGGGLAAWWIYKKYLKKSVGV